MANFQIKGTTVASMVLDLHHYDEAGFFTELEDKVNSAPQMFKKSPLVLDFSAFKDTLTEDVLVQIILASRKVGMSPIAARAVPEGFIIAVEALGLALLPLREASSKESKPSRSQPSATSTVSDQTSFDLASDDASSDSSAQAEQTQGASSTLKDNAAASEAEGNTLEAEVKQPTKPLPTKVISRPVRSGQQIYAEGSDLILLASVSEGAEILADGHIHVYGTLRGRALAGVKGDTSARIFCQQMEAELVSIAGQFVMNDTLRGHCWKQSAQVFLDEEEHLQVEVIK